MSGFGPAVLAWFENKVENLNDDLDGVVIGAGADIVDITRHHIETRGTAKSGKRGRIETSAMLNSVTEQVSKTPDETEVRAGYHDAPFYTVFQELGTSRIEAMYALTDAAEEVLPDLQKDIERVIKRA